MRNVPDEIHAELHRRAKAAGMTLSDYVLRELQRVTERPPMAEVLARSAAFRVPLSMADVVEGIRADRDGR